MASIVFSSPTQSSPAIHRGQLVNHFRIISYGSKFDFYLNDKFVIGLEDELWEKGTIGFQANAGSHVTVDDITIWQAVEKK